MELTGQQYFKFCHQLFGERAKETEHCDYYVNIGNRITARINFAGKHLVAPFVRAIAHLSTEPVFDPDVTICVWDNASSADSVFLYPFGRDSEKSKRHTCDKVQVATDLWPPRVSLYSAESKQALYWVSNVEQYPWWESCRPLRNIFRWCALKKNLYMMHAACIGTPDGAVLVAGKPGAGKSTSALSTLQRELLILSDDLCLIGFEGKTPYAYGIYNTAKLNNFDQLPGLEKYASNQNRIPGEKAFIYLNETFPEKLVQKMPLSAILVPRLTGERLSSINPMDNKQAFHTLVSSSSEELGGASAADFFGPYKICKETPCYSLEAGTDLDHLNSEIASVLRGTTVTSVGNQTD